jgi:hypothetical protein
MNFIYRQHAVKRMHERGIAEIEVEHALASGTSLKAIPMTCRSPMRYCLVLQEENLYTLSLPTTLMKT